jgi:hypothetical protein
MNGEEPTVPQWICEHCFIHLVNGDCTQPGNCHPPQCAPLHPMADHPLYLFGSMHVTPGMLNEHHSCSRDPESDSHGEEYDECDCETRDFSWSACDGCGDPHGGARYAVTGWIES